MLSRRRAPQIRLPFSLPEPISYCLSEHEPGPAVQDKCVNEIFSAKLIRNISNLLMQGNYIPLGKDQDTFFCACQGLDLQFPRTG
jgi:hypothetical protein